MLEEKNLPELTEEGKKNRIYTRRRFLTQVGILATGMIAAGSIAGCGSPENAAKNTGTTTKTGKPTPLPWKYQKLNVDIVRKRGFENYGIAGCCYGAASALLITLAETAGFPWNTIPLDMFRYGAGGAYSWGTLCGALNGSLAVVNLASAKHDIIGNELIGWYTQFPFPSDKHEAYCHFPKQVTTVAGSPLCHVSVSKWADKAGARINEAQKKDRCAKVTGDTAARAAELLNQALEGKITLAYKVPEEFSHCMACHQSKNSLLDDEQGKMNCILCHDDHTGKKN